MSGYTTLGASSGASVDSSCPAPVASLQKPTLDALDGLRGIGAICIVLYHFFSGFTPVAEDVSQYPVYAPEFTSVVTLFFVISGFTLTCVYNTSGDPPSALSFLKKRVARMAPIYYVSLLPALPSFYVYTTDAFARALVATTTLLWAQALIVPNNGWNMPLWQASAFAFTYPFFPRALAHIKSWSTRTLHIFIVTLMVVNVLVVVAAMQLLPLLNLNVGILHRWAPFRLPQFFVGMCAGILAQRGGISNPTVKAEACTLVLALSALVLCPLAVRLSPMFSAQGFPTWDFYDTLAEYVLAPIHALWLLALSDSNCAGVTRRVLASAPCRFLGDISYSLYCLHAPILYMAAWTIKGNGVTLEALPLITEPNTGIAGLFCFPPWAIVPLLAIIVAISTAAHFLVEKPCRKILNSLRW